MVWPTHSPWYRPDGTRWACTSIGTGKPCPKEAPISLSKECAKYKHATLLLIDASGSLTPAVPGRKVLGYTENTTKLPFGEPECLGDLVWKCP